MGHGWIKDRFFRDPTRSRILNAKYQATAGISTSYYINNLTGDDDNDGSISAPVKTIERAIGLIPSGVRPTVYLQNTGRAYDLTVLSDGSLLEWAGIDYLTVEGELVEGATYNMDSQVTTSDADGTRVILDTPNESYTEDQLKGQLIKFSGGSLNGQYGWIYANAASTGGVGSEQTEVRISHRREGDGAPGVVDVVFVTQPVKIENTNSLDILNSGLIFFNNLDFSGSFFSVSVWDAHRVEFNKCKFQDVSTILIGSYGRCQIATSWLSPAGVGFKGWGLITAVGEVQLTFGTVVDGSNASAANAHIAVQDGGKLYVAGEVTLLNLGNKGVNVTGNANLAVSTGILEGGFKGYLRFGLDGGGTATCANGLRFNQPNTVGSFGVGSIVAYGSVSSTYTVVAGSGARVRLLPNTSVTDGTGTNAVSADDGGTNVAQQNSKGTIILGGSPAATGW